MKWNLPMQMSSDNLLKLCAICFGLNVGTLTQEMMFTGYSCYNMSLLYLINIIITISLGVASGYLTVKVLLEHSVLDSELCHTKSEIIKLMIPIAIICISRWIVEYFIYVISL